MGQRQQGNGRSDAELEALIGALGREAAATPEDLLGQPTLLRRLVLLVLVSIAAAPILPAWMVAGWAGLFLIGEILDVDGRIGGFNFQWAWSSAWVAAQAIAKRLQA